MAATDDMDAGRILAGVPLFADVLDASQVRYLALHARPALFLAGTRLMNQGDFGGAMFVIVEGEVRVSFAAEDGNERAVATLGAGEVVGEMSLFSGDRRAATVSAVSNVHALEITKASLERVFAKAPDLADRFAAILATRQAELRQLSGAAGSPARESFVRRARAAFTAMFRRGA
jgi:CRP-like cAMP-binding protein